MDRAAFGVSRHGVLQRLLRENTGYGLFEADRLIAFALRRAAGGVTSLARWSRVKRRMP